MRRSAQLLVLWMLAAAGPASAQISVLSNTVEEHGAALGESYSGRIVISNPTTEAQTVRLYQTDYGFSANGSSTFDAAGSSSRSNASWISLQAPQVTLPPSSTASVAYTVVVPGIDSLRGTYWSAIMVEAAPRAPATVEANGKSQLAIGTVVRYAIQVATHIGGSGTRAVRFLSTSAAHSPEGAAAIDLDVQDVGERGYRPVLWIEVYDANGALKANAKQSRGLLFPGTSLHQHFDLGKLAPGAYKAVVYADTGEDSVYASQFKVVF